MGGGDGINLIEENQCGNPSVVHVRISGGVMSMVLESMKGTVAGVAVGSELSAIGISGPLAMIVVPWIL
jgi:hypothetical protein